MKFPRRLYRTARGPEDYCEEDDPHVAFLVGPQGMEISDLEAERNGIAAYFARTAPVEPEPEPLVAPVEAKEDSQTHYEDKAMEGPRAAAQVDADVRMGRRR